LASGFRDCGITYGTIEEIMKKQTIDVNHQKYIIEDADTADGIVARIIRVEIRWKYLTPYTSNR